MLSENAVPAGSLKIIRRGEKKKKKTVGEVLTNNQGLLSINYMLSKRLL